MQILINLIFLILFSSVAYGATPVIFYSDLTSGPNTGGQNNNGVFVTIWGNNFGTTQGSSTVTVGGGAVNNYPTWTNTEICFQLGSLTSTGNIVVTTSGGPSNGIPFTIRTGNIYFVNPAAGTNGNGAYATPFNTPASAYSINVAGDTTYIEGGTLSNTQYGYPGWDAMFGIALQGTQADPIAYVAYPNDTVTISSTSYGYVFRSSSGNGSSWITIAKLNLTNTGGSPTIAVNANPSNGWRIVGNNIQATNTDYGIVDITGTYHEVLGNEIHNSSCGSCGGPNEVHAIYIDGENNPFEVAWNYIHDNTDQGYEINAYHNGPRIGSIHDNFIVGSGTTKGILVDGEGDNGTDNFTTMYTNNVQAYNNIIINEGNNNGGDDGAIGVWCGTNYIYNNTIYGIGDSIKGAVQIFPSQAPCGPGGGLQVTYFANNIIDINTNELYISNGANAAPNWSAFSLLTNNNYYGEGNGPTQDAFPINANPLFVSPSFTVSANLQLQSGSPNIAAGYNTNSIVPFDFTGASKPNPPTIGAYEYNPCLANGSSCSTGPSCCSGVCTANVCSNSCSVNGISCTTGATCCSGICNSNVCSASSCSGTGISCSTGSSCCSGICCSNLCALSCGGSVGINAQLTGQCTLTATSGLL